MRYNAALPKVICDYMVLKWLKKWLKPRDGEKPRTVARRDHPISREMICEHALKVLYRLNKNGYQAYLVGGGVRDLLLQVPPKDFDVVTNATPDQIRRVFRNCRLIGRRFRLAHICFGSEIIEVATFRSTHTEPDTNKAQQSEHGVVLRDNVYGKSIADDVYRRDFTLNALYYNIADYSIIDYVGGLEDIRSKTLRIIGNAEERYREDPVRMLRAVRFASQRGLTMAPDTEQPIATLAPFIAHAAPARLFEELFKLFLTGKALVTFQALSTSPLFPYLFPEVAKNLHNTPEKSRLVEAVLKNTDDRFAEDKPITLAFVLAGILWPAVVKRHRHYKDEKPLAGLTFAISDVMRAQCTVIQIPRRIQQLCEDIWVMQQRLIAPNPKRIEQIVSERRFRAAYDFLLLRAKAGDPVQKIVDWWTQYQDSDEEARAFLCSKLQSKLAARKKRKK